jgi:hypothetical protein
VKSFCYLFNSGEHKMINKKICLVVIGFIILILSEIVCGDDSCARLAASGECQWEWDRQGDTEHV